MSLHTVLIMLCRAYQSFCEVLRRVIIDYELKAKRPPLMLLSSII